VQTSISLARHALFGNPIEIRTTTNKKAATVPGRFPFIKTKKISNLFFSLEKKSSPFVFLSRKRINFFSREMFLSILSLQMEAALLSH